MNVQGENHWQDVLAEIRKSLRKQQYETWFKKVQFASPGGEQIQLIVPNRFYADWMESNYRSTVEAALQRVLGFSARVTFEVDASAPDAGTDDPGEPAAGPAFAELGLNESYQIDTFVVGNCNRLAQAAARSVAECPGTVYNPLYVHGGPGLGKTHLLQAICRRFMQMHPGEPAAYVPAQQFVNELVQACEERSQEAFRAKYCGLSLLALDDVQLLANRESSQGEFFHAFNELHSQKRQVVVAGDRPPQEVPGLSERLVSRLLWGLSVRLENPDRDTRIAILRQKAGALRLKAPDELFEQIASGVEGSVRDIEGALVRVRAYASLMRKEIGAAVVREALATYGARAARPIEVGGIQEAVARHFSLKVRDLLGKKRARSVAFPRQIGMYLARCLTNASLQEIGQHFGGRDHTTVIYANEKIEKLKGSDEALAKTLQQIMDSLNPRHKEAN